MRMEWLLIFLLLVSACTNKQTNSQLPTPSPVATEVSTQKYPDEKDWERWYKLIDDHTKLAKIPELRKHNLPEGDIEVRVWYGVSFEPMQCIILKREQGIWRGIFLKANKDWQPTKVALARLQEPLSNWEACWQQLQGQGIINFPEYVGKPALDGSGYLLEVRLGNTYKVSNFANPRFSEQKEAKQMLEISNILAREFRLPYFEN